MHLFASAVSMNIYEKVKKKTRFINRFVGWASTKIRQQQNGQRLYTIHGFGYKKLFFFFFFFFENNNNQ